MLPEAAIARQDLVLRRSYQVAGEIIRGCASGAADHDQGAAGSGEFGQPLESDGKLREMMNGGDGDHEVVVSFGQLVSQNIPGNPGDIGWGARPSTGDALGVRVDTGDLRELLSETNRQDSITSAHVKSSACVRRRGVEGFVVVVDVVVPHGSFFAHLAIVACTNSPGISSTATGRR